MPTTTTDDGVELYYEVDGEGETVVFVGEAGFGAWQWGWQHGQITGPCQTVVWDLRGTGRSDSPSGPYSADRLAQDLEAVLAAADVRNAHLVGFGLGGMVSLRYAREFSRAETLSLFNTASSGSDVDTAGLRELCGSEASTDGVESSLTLGFSESFRAARADLLDEIRDWRREEDAESSGLESQLQALESFESGPLYELTLPALVCHGLNDPIVDSDSGRKLAEELPNGTFEPVEGKHLCFIEHSRAVTDRLLAFIESAGGKQRA